MVAVDLLRHIRFLLVLLRPPVPIFRYRSKRGNKSFLSFWLTVLTMRWEIVNASKSWQIEAFASDNISCQALTGS
ncbi:unnamed protein product [Linum trigynum]|uniref:Secreted protein n=1 Tax=Linum trigynum TaxID=586398 RepID=A0AAV2D9E9_9ROSI